VAGGRRGHTGRDAERRSVAPKQAVEKSLAGEGLRAHVVVSKYVDHLPLHRLAGIFTREGIDLARATLCDWVADVATALTSPSVSSCAAADYLQTSDTSVTVLGDQGGSLKRRLWTYLDPLGPQVVFDATATHERTGSRRGSPPSWGTRSQDTPGNTKAERTSLSPISCP
jgi:transposase